VNIDKSFPLVLNICAGDADILLQGAANLPYNVVAAVLQNVQQQIQAQLALHQAAITELGDGKGSRPSAPDL
jgi:hypothetical protein